MTQNNSEEINFNPKQSVNVQLTAKKVLRDLIKETQDDLPFSLSVSDLKILLPYGETKIYQMLETGKIPAKKIEGKWVISRDQFLTWYYSDEVKE